MKSLTATVRQSLVDMKLYTDEAVAQAIVYRDATLTSDKVKIRIPSDARGIDLTQVQRAIGQVDPVRAESIDNMYVTDGIPHLVIHFGVSCKIADLRRKKRIQHAAKAIGDREGYARGLAEGKASAMHELAELGIDIGALLWEEHVKLAAKQASLKSELATLTVVDDRINALLDLGL